MGTKSPPCLVNCLYSETGPTAFPLPSSLENSVAESCSFPGQLVYLVLVYISLFPESVIHGTTFPTPSDLKAYIYIF